MSGLAENKNFAIGRLEDRSRIALPIGMNTVDISFAPKRSRAFQPRVLVGLPVAEAALLFHTEGDLRGAGLNARMPVNFDP
ncbi:hypothetical protein ELH53_17900 [Rhizobium ruizarguesonis]|uniref:hypothetical protein n=1 Tax=Rhizobium ruizarguesonis TaxID=2081791 RepID=UPI00103122F4|nr:hypothetical protein [Rhizobium ruizarguesonis]TAZ97203.1 hypothetical protein ELH67_22805 [Rhizobium ruizarguesonis]TBA40089.1 hypothetical protein ELH60_23100 [Rhizobium ruizarguesonis]TBA86721.1 hypothetical protein ELH53_17900 [Rhizobium ruizarguesonis]TBC65640.1 hypothetical protein ELH36_24305 [Rhizobium ruizarguesonis]